MIETNTQVTFYTPATKVGTIVAHIPANTSRSPYVLAFLENNPVDYEIRMGSLATMGEDSYLVVVQGACSRCRKKLYHIPISAISHDIY